MKYVSRKKLSIVVLSILMSSQLLAAPVMDLIKGGVKSIDQLISRSGVTMGTDAATQLSNSLELTIRAFNKGKYPKSSDEIKKIFSFDNRLTDLLSKDVSEFTDKDLVKLVNRLSVQAEKRANGPFMMCGACVTDELYKMGVIAISQKASKSTSRILKILPRNAKQLNRRIKRMAGVLNIPNMDVILSSIPDVDKRRFYVALSKMSSGTKQEKALGVALRNFSNFNGTSYFHKSKLYTLMTDKLSPSDMKYWTEELEKIAKQKPIDNERGRVANLEQMFLKKADNNPSLKESLEKLKKKNCWKIFR